MVGAIGTAREAEPVAADDGAVLHHDTIAEPHALADRRARMEDAVVANAGARANGDVRVDDRPRADGGSFADADEGCNRCVGGDGRAGCDVGEPVHARRAPFGRREDSDRAREGQIRIGRAQHRAWRRLVLLTEDDGRRPGCPHRRDVLRVGEERDVARPGVFQPCHAPDIDRAVAFETAVQALGEFLQQQGDRV